MPPTRWSVGPPARDSEHVRMRSRALGFSAFPRPHWPDGVITTAREWPRGSRRFFGHPGIAKLHGQLRRRGGDGPSTTAAARAVGRVARASRGGVMSARWSDQGAQGARCARGAQGGNARAPRSSRDLDLLRSRPIQFASRVATLFHGRAVSHGATGLSLPSRSFRPATSIAQRDRGPRRDPPRRS